MKVTLVSAGMGGTGTLTAEAGEAIVQADCIIGAERLLSELYLPDDVPALPLALPVDVARYLRDQPVHTRPVVILSGDAGFYSGARRILELLAEEPGAVRDVTVIPGVSTVQYFAARLRRPWQDMRLASAHGVPTDVLAEVLNHPCVFLLTGGKQDVPTILRDLMEAGLGEATVTVGENLAAQGERIRTGTVRELARLSFPSLAVMLIENSRTFTRRSVVGGIPDSDFIRGDVPMTKREVRAIALSLLAPESGDILYDVGAGTGSVSVELANSSRRGRVYAVERQAEACDLIRQNRERFGVYNLRLVEGAAPEALRELPRPDRAFIGGSGGDMRGIIRELVGKNPSVRLAVSAICLETVVEVMDAFKAEGLRDVQVVQVAVSRGDCFGKKHLLRAENPIFLLAAGGGHGE